MFVLWFLLGVLVLFFMYIYLQLKLKLQERCLSEYEVINHIFLHAQLDQNNAIYNISGRLQGQNQPPYPSDAYLSADSIAITNELNKPPKYDDAPPSYEEAIKLAVACKNSMETYQAEQAEGSQCSSSAVPAAPPAVLSRTTE